MRHSLGTAVFAGMLGVTVFGLAYTPAFYTAIRRFGGSKVAGAPRIEPGDMARHAARPGRRGSSFLVCWTRR